MDLNYLYHRGQSLMMAALARCEPSRAAHLALAHGYVAKIVELRRLGRLAVVPWADHYPDKKLPTDFGSRRRLVVGYPDGRAQKLGGSRWTPRQSNSTRMRAGSIRAAFDAELSSLSKELLDAG